jgi:hypothetical protein
VDLSGDMGQRHTVQEDGCDNVVSGGAAAEQRHSETWLPISKYDNNREGLPRNAQVHLVTAALQ